MRSRLIDKITQLEPGKSIQAVKQLHAEENYLEDHFPRFAIMPGVLMLETMYQAAMWLVRKTDDFTHSLVLLKEARSVKFAGFVRPGQTLVVFAEIKNQDGNRTTLVTRGTVEGRPVVSARLVLEHCQLADLYPQRATTQDYLIRKLKHQFERVTSGTPELPPNTVGLAMRWMWLDRIVEFVRGEKSVAIKNVSLTEDPLSEYLPGFPILPCSLIVEGLALTGGILANDRRGFLERIVLAKINKAIFHRPALPGDQLRYTAVIEGLEDEGAFIRATSHVGEELQAEVDLFLAHLGDRFSELEGDLIDPVDTLVMLRLFGLYDVGRTADGAPLDVAPKLLDAERAAQAASQATTV